MDSVEDALDNCPVFPNVSQSDVGGVAGAGPDLIGDACQCGDLSGDAVVLVDDWVRIEREAAGLNSGSLFPERCNVAGVAGDGPGTCGPEDGDVVRNALAGLAPGPSQICGPALP